LRGEPLLRHRDEKRGNKEKEREVSVGRRREKKNLSERKGRERNLVGVKKGKFLKKKRREFSPAKEKARDKRGKGSPNPRKLTGKAFLQEAKGGT